MSVVGTVLLVLGTLAGLGILAVVTLSVVSRTATKMWSH